MPSSTRLLPCLFALTALANLGMCCGGPRNARASRPHSRQIACSQLPGQPPRCPAGTRCVVSGRWGSYTTTSFCLDQRNRRTGRYLLWRHRKLYERGELFENKRHGSWYRYDGRGQLVSRTDYHAGKLHGLTRQYRNKRLLREYRYVGGKLHGESREFYPNGKLRSTKTYKSGLAHGRERRWQQSGLLVSDMTRIHGRLHGPWRQVTGGTITTGRYVRGLPEGTFVVRSLAGKKLGSFSFQSGDGSWRRYYADGTLQSKEAMRLGMLHGSYRRYWRSGKLAQSGRYHIGKREGSWRHCDFHGRPTRLLVYRAGRQVESRWIPPEQRPQQPRPQPAQPSVARR